MPLLFFPLNELSRQIVKLWLHTCFCRRRTVSNSLLFIKEAKMILKWPSMAVYWLFMAIKRSFSLQSFNKIENDYTFISFHFNCIGNGSFKAIYSSPSGGHRIGCVCLWSEENVQWIFTHCSQLIPEWIGRESSLS